MPEPHSFFRPTTPGRLTWPEPPRARQDGPGLGAGLGVGVASLQQLLQAGFTSSQIVALERRGEIIAVHDGVYRTASTVLSPRRRLLAACLALGDVTAASDRAALWLWDLCDAEPPVEVTTASRDHPRTDGIVLHVREDLDITQISVHRANSIGRRNTTR